MVAEYVEVNPPYLYADYKISQLRAPLRPLVAVPDGLFRRTPGPDFSRIPYRDGDADLNHQHAGAPIGQRIILFGRVIDSSGKPVPHTLIETWQVNGAGRYDDAADPAFFPLDPNFTGPAAPSPTRTARSSSSPSGPRPIPASAAACTVPRTSTSRCSGRTWRAG